MKIYTSYFAKANKLPASLMQVAICLHKPDWFTGPNYTTLAPSAALLHDYKLTHDKDSYTKEFSAYLSSLNFIGVMEYLKTIGAGRDIVLLCYERPTDFCHRHLVADWLTKHGQSCEEFNFSS